MAGLYDPEVGELADVFVADLIAELNLRLTTIQREGLTQRTAKAMQQAIEDELEAIREELS